MLNAAHSPWKLQAWIICRAGQVLFAWSCWELHSEHGCWNKGQHHLYQWMKWGELNDTTPMGCPNSQPGSESPSCPCVPLAEQADVMGAHSSLPESIPGIRTLAASLSKWNTCHAIRVLQENLHTKLEFSQPLHLLGYFPPVHKRLGKKTTVSMAGGEEEEEGNANVKSLQVSIK